MNFGIDIGNGYVKYSQGGAKRRFASRIKAKKLNNLSNKKDVHQVEYKGVTYVLGAEDGNKFATMDRYFTLEYRIAMLTAIALSSVETNSPIRANVVVGVPAEDFGNIGADVEAYLNKLSIEEIEVDGKKYTIEIKKVSVFLEGAWVIKEDDEKPTIVVDVGAGTINIVEWEGLGIVNQRTINGAFTKLHSDMAEYLRGLNKGLEGYTVDKMYKYMDRETLENKYGESVEVKGLADILSGFIGNVVSNHRDTFSWGTESQIVIMGGGAGATLRHWQKHFPKAKLVENSQHTNQEVYEAVACSLYADDEE